MHYYQTIEKLFTLFPTVTSASIYPLDPPNLPPPISGRSCEGNLIVFAELGRPRDPPCAHRIPEADPFAIGFYYKRSINFRIVSHPRPVVVDPFIEHLRRQIDGFPVFGGEAVFVIDAYNIPGPGLPSGDEVIIVGQDLIGMPYFGCLPAVDDT